MIISCQLALSEIPEHQVDLRIEVVFKSMFHELDTESILEHNLEIEVVLKVVTKMD